jgi:hypothetical protein
VNIQLAEQAMPGDEIYFASACENGTIDKWAFVKLVKWEPAPKGGKVAVYETNDGEIVPLDSVKEIRKNVARPEVDPELSLRVEMAEQRRYLIELIGLLDIPLQLRTAMVCIMSNEAENLKVSKVLIDHVLEQKT